MKTLTLFLCTYSLLVIARADSRQTPKRDREVAPPSRLSVLLLSEVTRAALANNASIKAMRAKWEMMKARIPQAAAWEDAMVGVDIERMGTTRLNTFTDNEWMASQKIPIAGKNRTRARAANAEALATLQELRRQQLDVVSRARAAYFRLINADAQIEVNRRNESLLSQFVESSRAKYEVGAQSQSSVLIAQTDLIRLLEERTDRERELSDAQSQLNVLTNQPARAPLGRPVEISIDHCSLDPRRIEALALNNRPELARAENEIAAKQQNLEAARRDWIPEPQLRVEARQYNGHPGIREYDTGIFFNVPWGNWRKYSAQQGEARSSVEIAIRELEAARFETLGLVRDALKKVETFHHHVELFRDRLLPTARQTVEANQASYEADKTSFLDLITAQRSLRDIESMYHRHLADYRVALAELEAVVGADLRIFPSASFTTTTRNSK